MKLRLYALAVITFFQLPNPLRAQVDACCCHDSRGSPCQSSCFGIVVVDCPTTCVNSGGPDCTTGEFIDGLECLETCQASSLPIELTYFEARLVEGQILLLWETATETNNAGFDVEHEIGSDVFVTIGHVEGHGTSLEPKLYSFSIDKVDPGLHRYRLKQIDLDGAVSYSDVVETLVTVPDRYVLEAAYPNPFNPSTRVRFAVASEQNVRVDLYDDGGRLVRTLYDKTTAADQMQTLHVDGTRLSSGNYSVHLTGEFFTASERITLVK